MLRMQTLTISSTGGSIAGRVTHSAVLRLDLSAPGKTSRIQTRTLLRNWLVTQLSLLDKVFVVSEEVVLKLLSYDADV